MVVLIKEKGMCQQTSTSFFFVQMGSEKEKVEETKDQHRFIPYGTTLG